MPHEQHKSKKCMYILRSIVLVKMNVGPSVLMIAVSSFLCFFGANVFDVLLRMFFSSSTVPDIDTIREEKLTTIDIFIRASGKGMRENL